MANVNNKALTEGLSGKSDTQPIFRHLRKGRTGVVSQSDFGNRGTRAGQLRPQNRFQQAAVYARQAAETKPIYRALAQNTSSDPYSLAFSDWLHAPVIHEVTHLYERIRVDATDNVLVTKVVITILGERGQILEQGEAALIDDAWWEYATSALTDGNIIIEAFDLAGNVTKYEA